MLCVPRGTIRATVLIETITAAFEMEEIIYELRQHSSGLNCGRWDYIFSFIKKFRNHPDKVLPNRCELGCEVWRDVCSRSAVQLLFLGTASVSSGYYSTHVCTAACRTVSVHQLVCVAFTCVAVRMCLRARICCVGELPAGRPLSIDCHLFTLHLWCCICNCLQLYAMHVCQFLQG
jgi:hypothetical protein